MSTHDETASLLVGSAVTSAASPANYSKPVLMRQECTTFLVSSHHPQLSLFSDSEEDGSLCLEDNSTRSVPDIELHCRYNINFSINLCTPFIFMTYCCSFRLKESNDRPEKHLFL